MRGGRGGNKIVNYSQKQWLEPTTMKNSGNKKVQKQFSNGQIDASILHEQQIIYTAILEVAKLKAQIFLASVTSHHLHTDQVENVYCGESSKDNFIF